MRRTAFATTILAALLLTAPTAAAQEAELSLRADPEEVDLATGESRVVAITVYLNLSDFACFEPARFPVTLQSNTTGGITGTLENDTVWFDVPEESYLSRTYHGEALVNATLVAGDATSNGTFDVLATFEHSGDPCLVTGGFGPVEAHTSVHADVTGPDSGAGADEQDPQPDATDEDANTTADANDTAQGNESDDAGNATSDAGTPPPGSGPIGDYDPGIQESAQDSTVPAPALGIALAALAAIALARRRRG